jgi:hypothetical protein
LRDNHRDDPYDDHGDLSLDDSRDYPKDDLRDNRMDSPIDDHGVRLKDDLHNDLGDRPLDGLGDDLMGDPWNHHANPRPYFWPRNLTVFWHLGDSDSFGSNEGLNS